MATTYQVTIQLSAQTLDALRTGGFELYVLQGMQAPGDGQPLVWLRTATLAQDVALSWTDTYQAYVSQSTGSVTAYETYDVSLGQTLYVSSADGTGAVQDEGVEGGIGIMNETTQPITGGISLEQGGAGVPLCAFPIHGGNLLLLVPNQQVFLMFSSVTGQSELEQSLGPGVLVDLGGASSRTVDFDIDLGWSWGGETWARSYPPLTGLAAVLFQPYTQVEPATETVSAAEEEPSTAPDDTAAAADEPATA